MTPKQIKQARLKLKMSQAEFAKHLHVRSLTVLRWESGQATPSERSTVDLEKLTSVDGWTQDPMVLINQIKILLINLETILKETK